MVSHFDLVMRPKSKISWLDVGQIYPLLLSAPLIIRTISIPLNVTDAERNDLKPSIPPRNPLDSAKILFHSIAEILNLANLNSCIVFIIIRFDLCQVCPTFIDVDFFRQSIVTVGLGEKSFGE